jgi:hypothetical protein
MIVSVVVSKIVRGQDLSVPLREALMMVLAVYFATRSVVSVAPETLAKLEREGHVPVERHPLYLPKFSVRIIIVLSFLGAAAFLYQQGRLFMNPALISLGLVGAYLVGAFFRPIGKLLERWEFPASLLERFADLRALFVILAVGALTVGQIWDLSDKLPPWAEPAALTLLLYYFGAR